MRKQLKLLAAVTVNPDKSKSLKQHGADLHANWPGEGGNISVGALPRRVCFKAAEKSCNFRCVAHKQPIPLQRQSLAHKVVHL